MTTKLVCDNGLRIITENMPQMRSVAIGIFVNVGSRYEKPEENGLTHFIEHMLFKGTHTYSAKQIAEEFDRLGAQTNAFTSKDQTCYYAVSLDYEARKTIALLADLFFNSTFHEEDIEKERQVILEEIAMSEDDPEDNVDERLWQAMFRGTQMAAPILGTEETLKTFTKEKIKQFMHEHYTPSEVIISLAGNVDDELVQYVVETFNQFKNTARPQVTHTKPQFQPNRVEREMAIEQAHLALGFEGLAVDDPDIVSLLVLNNIVGDSMSSRLFQKVREEKALAYSVYSYYSSYEDMGAWMVYGSTSMKQLDDMEQTILAVLEDVKRNGVTDEEIARAKTQLESGLLLGLETSFDYMNRNARNEMTYGEHRSVEDSLKELHAVTADSVARVIDRVLSKEHARSVIKSK
ncbi:M16 family metallopeptidase [Kurthia massiliensis]|uniref:M16 family metallopeptidase n=1 Tax=Kurthia massiliensis TaxID=1033739 RepID=UPI0002881D3C|nr:pitrilysin family protein [Kurthia massiliensis]